MYNNFFIIISALFLTACASENEIDISKSINVFESKNVLPFVSKSERVNAKLNPVKRVENILNSKSYNLTNGFIELPLKKVWEFDTDQNISDENPYLPEPIFIFSHAYLLNNYGVLNKINTENGKIVWRKKVFESLENTIIGTPAISGGLSEKGEVTIYVHNGSNQIFSINGKNGKLIWKKNHDLPFRGGMTSSKKSLFLSDYDGNFLSIDLKTGQTNWNVFLGSDYNSIYTTARPIIAENKIILPGTGGTFFIISKDKGDVLWTENISSNKQLPKLFHAGDIVANPIYKDEIAFLVSQSGYISAFNISTSEELWSLPIGGLETPVLSGQTIFINGNMGLLAAIDIISGQVRWTKKYPSHVNEDSYFKEKEVAIYKGPTLIDSKIFFASHDGRISIMNANNGVEIDNLLVDSLALAPIPFENKVFFLTSTGKFTAYK